MTIEQVKQELKNYNGRPVKIMEVCGTHTASIFKNGIRSLLSPNIQLISGPGCPVCVTSSAYIDRLIEYALKEDYCILTFGDMMKVKGSSISLTEAKAKGAKVQILYSPLAAVMIALEHRHMNYIFAAVGFETTAPIYALLVEAIKEHEIKNLKLMTSIKTILPALAFLCDQEDIDAFLCPGHVSVITGSSIYQELSMRYQKPFVIAGFEGEHILTAVYEIVEQLKFNRPSVKNFYSSVVTEKGNERATQLINRYFDTVSEHWRGIGKLEHSGLKLKREYDIYDAGSDLETREELLPKGCRCADVILGRIHPVECPLFQKVCTPMNAIGPCMVSMEGACGIWYKNGN